MTAYPDCRRRCRTALLFSAVFTVAACSQSVGVAPPPTDGQSQSEMASGFTRFPDMPLPLKSDLDLERTMVFGASEAWFGRLVLTTSFSPSAMFEFYREQMRQFGWQEVTSLRSAVSVLTYTREARVATIQIQKRTISGSEVTITVSPRGGQSPAFGGAGSTVAPAQAAPGGRIGASPLAPPPR